MSTHKLSFKNSLFAGLMAAVTAAIVNVILFFIFHASGIITDDIEIQPGQPMTVVPIIISSILPTLIAACVFFLLEKFTSRGMMIFTIVSIVLCAVSFVNPFLGIKGVTVGYAMALNLMHVTVVVFLLMALRRMKKKVAHS